jgi:comEA protein
MRGFTRSEQRAILFLLSTFGVGTAVWLYRQSQPLPEVDPTEMAAFEEFVQGLQGDSAVALVHTDASQPAPNARSTPVDLNAATYNDLLQLPGIGPVMAKRIIAFREANGAFMRLQDLRQVKGIGAKTYEKLAPLLTIK